MFKFFKSIFIWWQNATIGTWMMTWTRGKKVGTDGQGNTYYQTKDGSRRWVIYNGLVEASRVPPDWHLWLHKTVKEPPTDKPLAAKSWEKPHSPNYSGTPAAYLPPGARKKGGKRPHATGDYEAWKP